MSKRLWRKEAGEDKTGCLLCTFSGTAFFLARVGTCFSVRGEEGSMGGLDVVCIPRTWNTRCQCVYACVKPHTAAVGRLGVFPRSSKERGLLCIFKRFKQVHK